jgi:hypothetical protein
VVEVLRNNENSIEIGALAITLDIGQGACPLAGSESTVSLNFAAGVHVSEVKWRGINLISKVSIRRVSPRQAVVAIRRCRSAELF